MSKETVAPNEDVTKLEVCSSKQREIKDRYEPSLTWVQYPTGRRVGYLNFTRNKKRYRKKIASTNEATAREIRDRARKMKADCISVNRPQFPRHLIAALFPKSARKS